MSVVVARAAFVAAGHRSFHVGSLVDSSDPVVKANPELFESVELAATAGPPEKIAGKKKAAPKAAAK